MLEELLFVVYKKRWNLNIGLEPPQMMLKKLVLFAEHKNKRWR